MSLETWRTYNDSWIHHGDLGFSLDVSRVIGLQATVTAMGPAMDLALAAMADLEAGARANPDEDRQVGHYWLRDPDRAPHESAANLIRETLAKIKSFAREVHAGRLAPAGGGRFRHVLHIGIGGSALGPQLTSQVVGSRGGGCRLHFFDNTDPDGFQQVLAVLGKELGSTLTVVASKSGGTRETRNGMLVAAAAYRAAGLEFAPHAVAITGEGSILDEQAREDGWRLRLPLPDWVGGRTSQTAAVGLLPLALAGGDVDAFLEGARCMDALTRRAAGDGNPAVAMALAWHAMTGGAARRSMVVLPYKDRLGLLARYLQ
ncbi:MAG: glucose-6-phosphate isomerase, partial [Acidobacteria bacterium]|nr:glucose-6-phosphate isomerase [Acidobacteriota bacterium]